MKSGKLSFDFSDSPQIVELLRITAAKKGKSLKAIVSEALERYFDNEQENVFLMSAADKAFAEWDNSDDDVYDTL